MNYLTNAIIEGLEERKKNKAEVDAVADREAMDDDAQAHADAERAGDEKPDRSVAAKSTEDED